MTAARMLPCCSRRQRSRVGVSAGASAPHRGDDRRLREREFDGGVDSEADTPVGSEQVENPLSWEDPHHTGNAESPDAEDHGSDDEMEAQPLRPVALVPRGWAAPDTRIYKRATVLASSAQLPSDGSAGEVCCIGSEKYEYMPAGGWVLVANECGRLELWERGFCAETRKLAAFEVLLRSMTAGQELDGDEDVVEALRVQLHIRCTSSACVESLATMQAFSRLSLSNALVGLAVGRCIVNCKRGRRLAPARLVGLLVTRSSCCASGNMKISTPTPNSTNGLIDSLRS